MPGILCEHCTGFCCRYIALPIDEPESKKDYDDIRWYLLHEGVAVFIEDGEWFINISTTCRHLQEDFRCGIYETRPRICREYSTENCDYHSGDYGWEAHFTCPEHLTEYEREQRAAKRNGKSAGKKKKKGGRVRPAVKVRLSPLRKRKSSDAAYAAMTTDIRGVPLPVLRGGS